MAETTFVRLYEYCDWEGESWNWWLQKDGNERDLLMLHELLRREAAVQGTDLWYELHLEDEETESVVDKLVQYADSGYHDSDNKVVGKFVCPEDLGADADILYKGGITKFFAVPVS